MVLDFDIMSAPPDNIKIAGVRAELAAERQRLKALNKRFLITVAAIVAVVLSFILLVAIPYVSKPSSEGSIVFIIVYSLPYIFFSIFVIGNTMHHDKVEVPRKALETAEKALEEGAQEDIVALRDACRAHAPLGAYQSQVKTQGRTLFNGELEAMRHWLEEHACQGQ